MSAATRPARPPARPVPRWPYAVAAGALLVEVAVHLVDTRVLARPVPALDSAREWSYSHVLSSGALLAGGLLCAVGARRARRRRARWGLAAGIFGVLFLDNVSRLHTHLGWWPVVLVPVLGVLAAALLGIADGEQARTMVALGLGMLLLSLAIHIGGPPVERALGWGPDDTGTQVKIALKEGTELAGWLLVVLALWHLLPRETA